MAKKGQRFEKYSEELKMKAVEMYLHGGKGYQSVADALGIRNASQVKAWVKKQQNHETLQDQRGKHAASHPFIGRPRTKFSSIEEERDYLKAQVEFPKKAQSKSTRGGIIPKVNRFEIISSLSNIYPITWLVEIAKVSRAGFYKWKSTEGLRVERHYEEMNLKEHILSIHLKRPFFGYPRIHIALKKEGFIVNHKRVYRLMKELHIQSTIRKKRRYYSKKASVVHPNRVARNFKIEQPNRLFATDITYIALVDKFYFLSAIQDLFNNEIVAWKVSKRNDLQLVLDTTEELYKQRDVQGAILHSDQGFQYTSQQYNRRLEEYGLLGSHSHKGNCLDNACIESFFSHLKTETSYFSHCKTEEELFQAIDKYIWFYNHERFQKRLNQCAPVEYRNTLAA
ncbi:IS3 family transposase [Brevibacillus ginsengisoli]|uniref:IS3 family transposase n=1 Tax=Brevibacillus ginsengisoli TaxID=363854 RepID=UPI003CF81E59